MTLFRCFSIARHCSRVHHDLIRSPMRQLSTTTTGDVSTMSSMPAASSGGGTHRWKHIDLALLIGSGLFASFALSRRYLHDAAVEKLELEIAQLEEECTRADERLTAIQRRVAEEKQQGERAVREGKFDTWMKEQCDHVDSQIGFNISLVKGKETVELKKTTKMAKEGEKEMGNKLPPKMI